jgi:hypothetical protein
VNAKGGKLMFKRNLKKIISITLAFIFICLAVLLIYPKIEFQKNGKLYACRFSDDFSEFEENASYNELYFYYKKRDISLKTFNVDKFLCFYVLSFDYVEGDMRKEMFKLEEEYIENWLKNAEITENPNNIDVAGLIEGKTAIVKPKRYSGNNYENSIYFKLDGKEEVMYVFESNGLTVIQVGFSDESPKYIAYK